MKKVFKPVRIIALILAWPFIIAGVAIALEINRAGLINVLINTVQAITGVTERINVSAWNLTPSGCQGAAAVNIPAAGDVQRATVFCDGNVGDILTTGFLPVPDNSDGTFSVTVYGVRTLAAETSNGILGYDVSAQCWNSGDTFSSTFGATQAASIALNAVDQSNSATVSISAPGCTGGAPGDPVFMQIRLEVNGTYSCPVDVSRCKTMGLVIDPGTT